MIEANENIESELSENDIPVECKQICHNVFRITELIVSLKTTAQTSKRMKNIIAQHLEVLLIAQKAVLRAYAMNKNFSGTAFLLAPDIVATNWHVVNSAEFPIYFSNAIDLATDIFSLGLEALHNNSVGFEIVNLGKENSVLYSGYSLKSNLNHQVDQVDICQYRLDPILGVVGDFDVFDFSLLNVFYPSGPKVLFVPSSQFIQPGSNIVTIGFPGTELLNVNLLKQLNLPSTYEASLPPFKYLSDIFFGFGKKCVRVGTTKAPFGIVNNEWKELSNYTADIKQYCVVSDETVFIGNSGSPVICLDNCKVNKVLDRFKQEWFLVEFIGIHSGGEFVDCLNCLHMLPEKRKYQNPFLLNTCISCQAQPERKKKPFSYNYSISVHHSDFANCYMQFILPRMVELFPVLPTCILDYVNLHDQTQ